MCRFPHQQASTPFRASPTEARNGLELVPECLEKKENCASTIHDSPFGSRASKRAFVFGHVPKPFPENFRAIPPFGNDLFPRGGGKSSVWSGCLVSLSGLFILLHPPAHVKAKCHMVGIGS